EASIIWYLMHTFGRPVSFVRCTKYSCIGFFFSCITPSASGGQPAQVYVMRQDGLDLSLSTLVLLLITMAYKLVLVAIGALCMLFASSWLMSYFEDAMFFFWLGMALNVLCVVGMGVLAFSGGLATRLTLSVAGLLERFHLLRHRPDRSEHIITSLQLYHDAAALTRGQPRVLAVVLLLTTLQRCALFAVTCLVYLAFDLHGTSLLTILMLQATIALSVDMLPLPGGMGASEHLFLSAFSKIFGASLVLPAMLLSRGVGFYLLLFISALVTLSLKLTTGKKRTHVMIIGFYNYSVILTYLSLASAMIGMISAIDGRIPMGMLCLMISGVCDAFDGKIARAMQRTEDEKIFGIQIDSLCDLVCFGVLPAILCYQMGMRGIVADAILVLFVLGAVIRLGYFNVCEEKRQRETTTCRQYYQGLPVTSISFLLPIFYMLLKDLLQTVWPIALGLFMLLISVLFIANIKVRKPNTRVAAIIVLAGLVYALRFLHIA
ncbi:MAG: lysylphosphatidylglycerol synthase domain-containing protein, partial [Oscillospiraceae bacterium]